MKEKLNIVDEKGNIIGVDTRENIHKKGLLHQEIHVWIYNGEKEILFQHRANTDTFPCLLDASVNGHVEIGESFEDAALRELKEETGIFAKKGDLIFITETKSNSYDKATGNINNILRAVYAHRYDGDAFELKIEDEKATNLEFWPIKKLFNLSKEKRKEFVYTTFNKDTLNIFKTIKRLM